MCRQIKLSIGLSVIVCFSLWCCHWLNPVDLHAKPAAKVVLASGGEPLRMFADSQGVWRESVSVELVSPLYLQALLAYEDKWFYHHPGVNPLALLRASWQWLRHGRIVSGGSTITMQVVRLRYGRFQGISGKCWQILRALQLEFRYSKAEILNYYLNHAPFGGRVEGVQAASLAYFGYSAQELSHAQAALLAVLPQAPSRNRPDRYPQRAQVQRDKVLDRLAENKVWNQQQVDDAKLEFVIASPPSIETRAPLLARRLLKAYPQHKRLPSFIDLDLQSNLEYLVRDYANALPDGASVALMAMEHGSAKVRAYIGSADFNNSDRFAHVDMVKAWRSPGSTLKPFIYGLAMDQGLVHSKSLLMDVPLAFGDYRPQNFIRHFSGPVSLDDALTDSLNLPAVQVMEHLGPDLFYARLQSAGAKLRLPVGAKPNLAMALGGVASNLESLIRLYSALGNQGISLKPRLSPLQAPVQQPLLTPASAWVIRQLLSRHQDTDQPLAIKTGTSYGNRDAWAIAVSEHYTLGVWVGHPAGTPLVGHYGNLTAVPLLENAALYLKPLSASLAHRKPDNVSLQPICWPDGQTLHENCDLVQQAWLIDDTAPHTLMTTLSQSGLNERSEQSLLIADDSGKRVALGCVASATKHQVYLWPAPLQQWLEPAFRHQQKIPELDPRCSIADGLRLPDSLSINGMQDGYRLRRHSHTEKAPKLRLHVVGGQPDWYWFLNGQLLDEHSSSLNLPDLNQGYYQLLVLDQAGLSAKLAFWVE